MNPELHLEIYPCLQRSPEEKFMISFFASLIDDYLTAKSIVGRHLDHPDFFPHPVVFDNKRQRGKLNKGIVARDWIFDPTRNSEFCFNGFVSICRTIGIEPYRARKDLLAIDKNDVAIIRRKALSIKDRKVYSYERGIL